MEKKRLLWIDFLRGLAVLGMVETHAVNSFLAPVYRSGDGFTFLSYLNGWVAPTFLFLAGFLQGAWIRKNWDGPKPLLPKLRHLGFILLLGYALQTPWATLFDWEKVLEGWGKVDVLHCIAVSLAGLLFLSRLCKKIITYECWIAGLTMVVVAVAPFAWKSDLLAETSNPLVGFLNPHRGALFPLLPWSGFLLAGALTSRWLVKNTVTPGDPPAIAGVFAMLTLSAAALGWILRAILGNWFETKTYATRYDSFCFRLSLVFLSCALCSLLPSSGVLSKAIQWCGSRSLSLYFWHLILLHSGLGFLPPLRILFPKTQQPITVVWLYVLTLMITLLLTWLLEITRKKARPKRFPSPTLLGT